LVTRNVSEGSIPHLRFGLPECQQRLMALDAIFPKAQGYVFSSLHDYDRESEQKGGTVD